MKQRKQSSIRFYTTFTLHYVLFLRFCTMQNLRGGCRDLLPGLIAFGAREPTPQPCPSKVMHQNQCPYYIFAKTYRTSQRFHWSLMVLTLRKMTIFFNLEHNSEIKVGGRFIYRVLGVGCTGTMPLPYSKYPSCS